MDKGKDPPLPLCLSIEKKNVWLYDIDLVNAVHHENEIEKAARWIAFKPTCKKTERAGLVDVWK